MTTNDNEPLTPYDLALPQVPANWDKRKESVFIDLLVEKVKAGGARRLAATFSKNEWDDIRRKYYAICKEKYIPKAYKNKLHWLREKYKEHKKLVDENKGLGWNPLLCTVSANSKWWDDYIKSHPTSKWTKKFRTEGFPEFKRLTIIFGDIGTDQHHHDLNSSDEVDVDLPELPESIPNSTSRSVTPLDEPHTKGIIGVNNEVQEATSENTKRGKRNSEGVDIIESLKMLAETSKARFEDNKRRCEEEKRYAISECMKIIEAMQLALDDRTYLRVMSLLQEKGWRETFYHMTEQRRKAWIAFVENESNNN